MPRMNGVESTRRIKSSYPDVVIIGLTVNDDMTTLTLMQQAGACTIVNKKRMFDDIGGAIQIGMELLKQPENGYSTQLDAPSEVDDFPFDRATVPPPAEPVN